MKKSKNRSNLGTNEEEDEKIIKKLKIDQNKRLEFT
jgi:hypothetical protein